MKLERVKRVNLGDQVFNQMKEMIERGTWKENEKIPSERVLAEKLGVSHATMRQTLQKLNVIGLLETRVGEGSFVKALAPQTCLDVLRPGSVFSAKAWQDVTEFRAMLESYGARLAALRGTAEQIARLEQYHQQMLVETDFAAFADLDVAFHTLIGEMSHNDMVIKSYELLNSVLRRTIVDEIGRMGICKTEDHQQMLDAIGNKDPEGASQVMLKHIDALTKVEAVAENRE